MPPMWVNIRIGVRATSRGSGQVEVGLGLALGVAVR
jgi:hypothetical protein